MKIERTKRVNIYLTPKDKKELYKIKEKYHLSFSTIANIVTEIIDMLPNEEERRTKNLYELNTTKVGNATKTCIKPRNAKNHTQKAYQNCLLMFVRHDLKKYCGDLTEKVSNMIYKELENTWDENWNGNELNRRIPRLLKSNPDYYKKLLGVDND